MKLLEALLLEAMKHSQALELRRLIEAILLVLQ